jgi:hypothetical protein
MIFRLWFDDPRNPLHLVPLLYVQWFSNPRRIEKDINMYLVDRILTRDDRPLGEVIRLNSVTRQIQLIPKFGKGIRSFINSTNSLDVCKSFWVNSFMDKEVYQAVW